MTGNLRTTSSLRGWSGLGLSALLLLILLLGIPCNASAESSALDEQVNAYFGLFVVPYERRSSIETVRLNDGVLELDYHWSETSKKDLMCTGGRWIIVGRLKGAKGAREFFKVRRDVDRIRLRFLIRETRVEPIGDGRYRQKERATELARFELSAERARELNPTVLKNTLSGQRCKRFVESLLDSVSINEDLLNAD